MAPDDIKKNRGKGRRMGLDMTLSRKVSLYYLEENDQNYIKTDIMIDGYSYNFNKIMSITEEVMYWRKANQIHRWFVDNVQRGVDDSTEYKVDDEQLQQLYEICVEARLKQDSSLLPPMEGFFFGSTDIDKWYWAGITETIRVLKPIIDLHQELKELKEKYPDVWTDYINDDIAKEINSYYFYRASW